MFTVMLGFTAGCIRHTGHFLSILIKTEFRGKEITISENKRTNREF